VEVQLYLLTALAWGEWPASRPGQFIPAQRAFSTHWRRGWLGCTTDLNASEAKDVSCLFPGIQTQFLVCPARNLLTYLFQMYVTYCGIPGCDTVYSGRYLLPDYTALRIRRKHSLISIVVKSLGSQILCHSDWYVYYFSVLCEKGNISTLCYNLLLNVIHTNKSTFKEGSDFIFCSILRSRLFNAVRWQHFRMAHFSLTAIFQNQLISHIL
jgi:hypothetical protein